MVIAFKHHWLKGCTKYLYSTLGVYKMLYAENITNHNKTVSSSSYYHCKLFVNTEENFMSSHFLVGNNTIQEFSLSV